MSTSPRNKEYTAPTKPRCDAQRKEINQDTEAFLKKGGSVTTIEGDLETTDENIRINAKQAAARKRGLKNAQKRQGVAA